MPSIRSDVNGFSSVNARLTFCCKRDVCDICAALLHERRQQELIAATCLCIYQGNCSAIAVPFVNIGSDSLWNYMLCTLQLSHRHKMAAARLDFLLDDVAVLMKTELGYVKVK